MALLRFVGFLGFVLYPVNTEPVFAVREPSVNAKSYFPLNFSFFIFFFFFFFFSNLYWCPTHTNLMARDLAPEFFFFTSFFHNFTMPHSYIPPSSGLGMRRLTFKHKFL